MFFRVMQFSGIALLLTGCSSVKQFQITGNSPYCMVDYKHKTIDCSYNSMWDCTDSYKDYASTHCFKKTDLINKKVNELEREDD